MRQKHKRSPVAFRLEVRSQGENVLVTRIVHADNHVYVIMLAYRGTGFGRCLHPHELRRAAEIQVDIFMIYLCLNLPVLLKDECIVIAAYHQDFPYTELNQGAVVSPFQFFEHHRLYSVHVLCFING